MSVVIFLGPHEKIDHFGVQPRDDGFQSFCIGIDILIILAPGDAVDYVGKSDT
jgi:hypothetical protein